MTVVRSSSPPPPSVVARLRPLPSVVVCPHFLCCQFTLHPRWAFAPSFPSAGVRHFLPSPLGVNPLLPSVAVRSPPLRRSPRPPLRVVFLCMFLLFLFHLLFFPSCFYLGFHFFFHHFSFVFSFSFSLFFFNSSFFHVRTFFMLQFLDIFFVFLCYIIFVLSFFSFLYIIVFPIVLICSCPFSILPFFTLFLFVCPLLAGSKNVCTTAKKTQNQTSVGPVFPFLVSRFPSF